MWIKRWTPASEPGVLGARGGELLAQVTDLRGYGVAVNYGLVADVTGAVGIAQRLRALLQVDVGRAHARNHRRLAVAAERVLRSHHRSSHLERFK